MVSFREVLDHAGLEPRDYRGRGMSKPCVGVVTNRNKSVGAIFASVLIAIQEMGLTSNEDAMTMIGKTFEGMHEDQMGLDSILFFPTIPWTGALTSR